MACSMSRRATLMRSEEGAWATRAEHRGQEGAGAVCSHMLIHDMSKLWPQRRVVGKVKVFMQMEQVAMVNERGRHRWVSAGGPTGTRGTQGRGVRRTVRGSDSERGV
jgi:hypothetical protein